MVYSLRLSVIDRRHVFLRIMEILSNETMLRWQLQECWKRTSEQRTVSLDREHEGVGYHVECTANDLWLRRMSVAHVMLVWRTIWPLKFIYVVQHQCGHLKAPKLGGPLVRRPPKSTDSREVFLRNRCSYRTNPRFVLGHDRLAPPAITSSRAYCDEGEEGGSEMRKRE